jgi:hypothetical protein
MVIDTQTIAIDTSHKMNIGHKTPSFDHPQIEWMHTTLKEWRSSPQFSPTDLIMVMGHYPFYSVGPHGTNVEMMNVLIPILAQYRVDFYIHGHEHLCQYHEYRIGHSSGILRLLGSGASSYISRRVSPPPSLTSIKTPSKSFSLDSHHGMLSIDVEEEDHHKIKVGVRIWNLTPPYPCEFMHVFYV